MDGVTHINVYSKAETEVGRWLSNFTYCPVKTEDGSFNSIEGYWYWLTVREESLRTVHGFQAKRIGRESQKVVEIDSDVFREKICKALDLKLKSRSKWVAESVNLPLDHYYNYGGKEVRADKYMWIIEHLEKRIKQLKEYYEVLN